MSEKSECETNAAEKPTIDLSFRPRTYWPLSKNSRKLLSKIKGKVRRDKVREILEAGGGLEDVPEFYSQKELSKIDREYWGSLHPRNMGGEYLPELPVRTVEIARISLRSVTYDQWSVRATREKDRIAYSVVDEYSTKFVLAFPDSPEPLTLGELIRFIDESHHPDDCCGKEGLLKSHWSYMLSEGNDAEESFAFASIDSDFYPDLAAYYAAVADQWTAVIEAERRADGWYEEEEEDEDEPQA